MTERWHILGAGAIGSLFAASLHRAGVSTTLLCRSPDKYTRVHDIRIDGNGTSEYLSLPVSYNDENGAISHLLITTKAYDVVAAFSEVKHRLNADSQVILLVNGMGFVDDLASNFPDFQFTFGTTTEGAYRLSKGTKTDSCNGNSSSHFRHAGKGITRLGQAGLPHSPPWFKSWTSIDQACTWETNIEECLWRKLTINCAINPLTALHRCKNGELSTRPELTRLVNQLCDEIALVSQAAGFHEASDNIHNWVFEVIVDTRNNRSSMLQDTMAGRRTENDYISGYFLRLAERLKVKTPQNRAVFERVLQLDRLSRPEI